MEGSEGADAVDRRPIDSTLIKNQGIGDLYEMFAFAKRNGMDYNLIYIPS